MQLSTMLAIFFIYDQTLKKEWKAGLKGPERHRSLGCHINTWQRNLPKAAKDPERGGEGSCHLSAAVSGTAMHQ